MVLVAGGIIAIVAGFFPYVVDSSSRDLPWAPKINRISST